MNDIPQAHLVDLRTQLGTAMADAFFAELARHTRKGYVTHIDPRLIAECVLDRLKADLFVQRAAVRWCREATRAHRPAPPSPFPGTG